MKWEPYELYCELSRSNDIGQLENVLVPIDNIECVVSDKIYSNVTGEIAYRIVAPTGITKYKDLSTDKTYVIVGEGHQYRINSFSTKGRYAQLLLEETHFLDGAIRFNKEGDSLA